MLAVEVFGALSTAEMDPGVGDVLLPTAASSGALLASGFACEGGVGCALPAGDGDAGPAGLVAETDEDFVAELLLAVFTAGLGGGGGGGVSGGTIHLELKLFMV